jgi:hypothetical protein
MAQDKQATISKLGETLIKAAVRAVRVSEETPGDIAADDKERPGKGPDDKAFERENAEIVPLPHMG